jgi:hypothetical protein
LAVFLCAPPPPHVGYTGCATRISFCFAFSFQSFFPILSFFLFSNIIFPSFLSLLVNFFLLFLSSFHGNAFQNTEILKDVELSLRRDICFAMFR